jgi:hypothetical protein
VQSLALRSLPPRYALTNRFSPLTSLLAARATLARPLDSLSTAPRSSEFDGCLSRSRAAHLMHGPRARLALALSAGRAGSATLPYGLDGPGMRCASSVRAADRTVRPTCVVSRLITHGGSARHVESARRRSSAFGPRRVESGAQSVYGVQGLRCTVL